MTVTKPSELEGLKAIGGIVAQTLQQMGQCDRARHNDKGFG